MYIKRGVKMKLKNGYKLIPHNDEFLVCFKDEQPLNTVRLSKIGAFLWEKVSENDITSAQMLDLLLQEFEISTVLALGEIDSFIKRMKENGIFE